MALEVEYCISNKNDCKTFEVIDTTGSYTASNITGWGGSNTAIADIKVAEFTIEQRNSDGTFTELNTVIATPPLPNITEAPLTLTSIDFGYEDGIVIPDGIYRGTYDVYDMGDSLVASYDKTFVNICSLECCFKKLSNKAANIKCDTGTKAKFQEMSILMRGLEAAIQCGDLITIQNNIDYLTKLCSGCGCSCG